MTKPVTLTLPHALGRAEAKRRIDEGLAGLTQHMGAASHMLSQSWEGDRLSFAVQVLGQGVSGTVDVEDTEVRLEILLPNVLALMAGKVKGRLRDEGRLLLEKK
jgi:putative polyhydroxyalkanoate system protein